MLYIIYNNSPYWQLFLDNIKYNTNKTNIYLVTIDGCYPTEGIENLLFEGFAFKFLSQKKLQITPNNELLMRTILNSGLECLANLNINNIQKINKYTIDLFEHHNYIFWILYYHFANSNVLEQYHNIIENNNKKKILLKSASQEVPSINTYAIQLFKMVDHPLKDPKVPLQ